MSWLQKVRMTQPPFRGEEGILSFDREGKAWITLLGRDIPADGSEEPLGDPYESGIVKAYTGEDEEEEKEEEEDE